MMDVESNLIYKKIIKSYKCCGCGGIPKDTIAVNSCKHVFCQSCLYIDSNGSKTSTKPKKCPFCSNNTLLQKLKIINCFDCIDGFIVAPDVCALFQNAIDIVKIQKETTKIIEDLIAGNESMGQTMKDIKLITEENKEEVLIPPKPQIQKKDPKIAQDTYKAKIFVDEINEVCPAEEPDFSFLEIAKEQNNDYNSDEWDVDEYK